MIKINYLSALAMAVAVAFFTACGSMSQDTSDLTVPQLLVELRGIDYGGNGSRTVTLPVSGQQVSVSNTPLAGEFDILNVELVKVERGMALMLQLSTLASRELYRSSVTNKGNLVVLTINGNPVGVRRLDGAIKDGIFYTFVEIDDEELPQLVMDLKESIAKLQKMMH